MRSIPPFKLLPVPLNSDAESLPKYQWAPDEIGTRHQLGGAPSFLQGKISPKCSCGEEMTFYAQLDSINDEINLADCGLIYVFVCFDCFETKSILQSA